MSWLILVGMVVLLSGIGASIHRYILRDEHVYSYGFLFTFLSSLLFIPLMFTEEVVLPTTAAGWLLVLAAAVLWFTVNILGFTGVSKTESTLGKPLATAKILVVFVLSVVVLGEAVTTGRALGTLFVMAGMLVLTWRKGWLGHLQNEGVRLLLAAAVITGVIAIVDKVNMGYVSPNVYGFLMYFLPSLALGAMVSFQVPKLKQTLKNKWRAIVSVTVCYSAMYYFLLNAYQLADVQVIYPVYQLATLITLGLGYFWLKEKTEFRQRVAGAVLMIVGAVLVTLGA